MIYVESAYLVERTKIFICFLVGITKKMYLYFVN